ncbi:cohesin domain-containing protein [Neobacillus sp. K501]
MKINFNNLRLASLIFFITLLALPIQSNAAEEKVEYDALISVDSAKGSVGEVLDIPVKITQPKKDIAAYGIEINFDQNHLKVVGIKSGFGSNATTCTEETAGCFWSKYDNEKGFLRAAWADPTAGDHPIDTALTLFTVQVQVKDTNFTGDKRLEIQVGDLEKLSFTDPSNQALSVEVDTGKLSIVKPPVKPVPQDNHPGTGSTQPGESENGLLLKKVVTTVQVKKGESVSVSDNQVNILDQQGLLIVELLKSLDKIEKVDFSAEQLQTLIERQAKINVVKEDVELLIPATNFANGEDFSILLERINKNSSKLPSYNLAVSSMYDFTIKLGDKTIHHFDHPIELVFPTDQLKVAHPEELRVFYWNETSQEWELVGGKFEDGKIKAMTDHFSTFALFNPKELAADQAAGDSALPDTASNMYNWLVTGMISIILGAAMVLVQKRRQRNS